MATRADLVRFGARVGTGASFATAGKPQATQDFPGEPERRSGIPADFVPGGPGIIPGESQPHRTDKIESPTPLAQYPAAVDISGPFTLPDRTWVPITEISRPMLLVPLGGNASNTIIDGPIYYRPNNPITPSYPGIPGISPYPIYAIAQKSVGRGVCLLANPGRWYAYYEAGTVGGAPINVTMIDGSNPSQVARYLSEPGCHRTDRRQFTFAAVDTTIYAPSFSSNVSPFYFNAPVVQTITAENSGPVDVWLSINEVAAVNQGIKIQPGGFYTFEGPALTFSAIHAINDGSGTNGRITLWISI